MTKIYPWERRWLEISANKTADGPFHQVESNGYVAATEWTGYLQTQPIGIELEEIVEARQVVILLGEPGIGKSSEWRKLNDRLKHEKQHFFLNLGSFSSEDELRDAIQENLLIQAWKQEDYTLTLWLDSLDEGLLHMRKLQDTLLRVLQKLPIEKLHLRITCRNAVWPVAFTEALGSLWRFGPQPDKEQLSVLLLRPLTQQQVADAAQAEGLQADKFLTAIAEVDAQPLASIPVTLRLLLSLYKKHQPSFGVAETAGRAGLYELGCLELCDAPDEQRDEQHRQDGRKRLLLAGYLAYLAVFSNRRQIYIEPIRGILEDNALDPYAAGAGLTASWGDVRATVSPVAIRDLLKNTSLFTDLGNGCLVWVHQAFAEFLAAWYVNLAKVSVANLRALFRSEADPAGGVVPALRETAAWLAELQPVLWQELLYMDPLTLVRGDLRRLRDEQRAEVVQHLAIAVGALAYPPYLESRERNFMQQLHHPGLAGQLEQLLTSDNVPAATVRFAVDMAKGCNVQELNPVLTKQALDETQAFGRRAYALDILREIATDEAKQAVRPLIHHIPAEDDRDDFRGDLIWLLWPTHLEPDELLPLLTPEKDDHFHGSYRSFIYKLEKTDVLFSPVSVTASLNWLSQNWAAVGYRHRQTELWKRIALLIWRRAWQLIYEPGVKEALAKAYAKIVEQHDYFTTEGASDAARLQVFEVVLANHYKQTAWVSVLFAFSQQDALLSISDWDALFPLLYGKLSFSQRTWLAQILRRFLADLGYEKDVTYCQRYEQFLTAARKYASVRAAWREWFKPIVLKSKEARKERKDWLQSQKRKRKESWRKKNHRRVNLHKAGQQARFMHWVINREVDRACGNWCSLINRFQYEKTERNTYKHHDDPSQSKHWKRLALELQAKILDRIWAFITQYPIPPTTWYEPGDHSTYGAEMMRDGLMLSYSQREAVVRSQPPQFWQCLAPFLVRFDERAGEGSRYELLRLAAANAPEEVESALLLSMDARDDTKDGRFSRFKDWCQLLPNSRFPALLLQGIELGVWREDLSAQVLLGMLEVDYAPAWEYIQELLSVPAGGAIERPKLAVAAFGWLLFRKKNHLPNAWQYWEWLSNHPDVAQVVISAEVSRPMPSEFTYLAGLAEEELEGLTLWLTYTFNLIPTDVDDWKNDSPRGKYANLRTAAVAELAIRGTSSAWRILEYLDEQLGKPFWIRGRLDQVRENLRRNAWAPVRPAELIELSQQAGKRWIKSATDLQEMVLESLGRLQADLHNELSVANVLWIPQKKGNVQTGHEVRDENFLSDVLRIYLDKDLRRPEILVKREVEIRKSVGKGTGQRTDLYVDAFGRDEANNKIEVITVVVEVKLAKNDETETALEGQLIPYLVDQSYKHGIYLVGWHYGQYDKLPPRKPDLTTLHSLLKGQTESVISKYTIRTLILDIRLAADSDRSKDAPDLFDAI